MRKDNKKINVVGIHAVRILLSVRPYDIYELYISDKNSRKYTDIVSMAKSNNIFIQKISNEKIFDISNVKSHQGVLAVANKKDEIHENDLINFLKKRERNKILLILDEVSDPRNFGACLRICDAYDVAAVIIKDHNSVDLNETVRKVAAGSAETIQIIKVKNISRILQKLKDNDYWIYGASDKANSNINDIEFKTPLALVIGGESQGLRKKTLENCDFSLKIDMKGVVESLNMAVATGIIINTIYSKIK